VKRAVGLVLLTAVALGCGGSSGSGVGSVQLKAKVAVVRAAAESGNLDATTKAIDDLARTVDSQVASGQLSTSRADKVRAAIFEVMHAMPQPTTTTTTAPPAAEATKTKKKNTSHDHQGDGGGGGD
jgi:hypothetical protein